MAALLQRAADELGRHEDAPPRGDENIGRRQRGFSLLKQAESLDPKSPDLYSLWGWYWFVEWEFGRSFAAYERALELQPDHPQAHLGIGGLFLQAAIAPSGTAEQLQQAIVWLEKARALGVASEDVVPQLALAYRVAGRHDDALEASLALRDLEPESWKAWNMLGLAYRNAGDSGNAVRAYEKALVLQEPELASPAQDESAATQYQRASLLSARGVIMLNIGVASLEIGRIQEAVAALRDARALQSDLVTFAERFPEHPYAAAAMADARSWSAMAEEALESVEAPPEGGPL